MDLVWNRAPWTRVRIADLADAIRLVDSIKGGGRLIDRFAIADQYSGAVLELDLAATAVRTGLVVELEPPTQPGRLCDLSVSLPGFGSNTTVFVEVQAVQDFGYDAKRAMEVINLLAPLQSWIGSNHVILGEIYRIPTEAELMQLLPVTRAFWDKCEGSTGPEHLQLDDVMDVWVVPFGHAAKAELIAAGVPAHFRGPVADDPLRRIVRAIRPKIGQLPTLAPGIIVIRPPRPLVLSRESLPQIVAAVNGAIAASPQVSGVALIDWVNRADSTPREARVPRSGAVIVVRPDRHIFVRQVILIPNPIRAYLAGDRVIERFL